MDEEKKTSRMDNSAASSKEQTSIVDCLKNLMLDEKTKEDQEPSCKAFRKTGLVYDERMQKHSNVWEKHHPECPQRIERIYQQLCHSGLVEQCERINSRSATFDELNSIHSERHISEMKECREKSPRELYKRGEDFDSIYLSQHVYESATLSAGCTLELLDAVLTNKVDNGAAVVRPPGHHALSDYPMGFCYFNNVALAAHFAKTKYGLKRVLIIDWDIHWGNGIAKIFEDDPDVLYVSLHRYDNGNYWPHQKEADYKVVGTEKGEGKTVQIAWNKKGLGDSDYLAAFTMVILPIAYEFAPELVLVSCGFDSGLGDPKGQFCVTPEGFAQLTHLLMGLANGKIILVLEGGYNLSTISYSMEACVKTLLGYPCIPVEIGEADDSAIESILNTARTQSKYWKSLKWAGKLLSSTEDMAENVSARLKKMTVGEKEEKTESIDKEH